MAKPKVFEKRIAKLKALIADSDVDVVAVTTGPSQVYFSGLHFHVSERPAVLLVSPGKQPAFIFPAFEGEKVTGAPLDLVPFPYQESRTDWVRTFRAAIDLFGSGQLRIGVEPITMRYLEMDLLGYKDERIQFGSAEDMISALRASKDEEEIDHIRQAIHIAETALEKTLPMIKVGVTEKEIVNELVINLLRAGSEPELPFFPIVASGPNSANPHVTPGDRALKKGDMLIIDWGARHQGYISDITRTFAIGDVSAQLQDIYQVVRRANQAARDLKLAQFTGQAIDETARAIIDQAGYGEAFLHRTGHGYGLEAHEPPYISSDNQDVIASGATFTIEPGIYLRGIGGVRIEDNICARDGYLETLTTLDRELITI